MVGVSLERRQTPSLRAALVAVALVIVTLGLALISATVVVFAPVLLRLLGFLLISFALAVLVLANPRAGLLTTLGFLVGVQLLRRILISETGWTFFDPLLLIGPFIVAVFWVQQFGLRGRPLAPDRLSLLVLFVLVLAVIEIPNPAGGGVAAGLPGFLYAGIPLMWFFVGREVVSEPVAWRLQLLVLCAGVAVALYGLCQTELGFPAWDRAWLQAAGYSSLRVGDEFKAFGTFASDAEYALFVGSALAIAAAWALHRRPAAALAIPPLAVALFLSSGRAALITAFLAVVVCCGLRTRRPATAAAVILVSLVGAVGALTVFGDSLNHSADNGGNALVSHQVGGLTDPLNPNSSTLLLHFALVVDGIKKATHQPLGRGTGASNHGGSIAAGNDTDTRSTEIDLSNSFVNSGMLGGIAYLALFGLTFVWAIKSYFAGVDVMLGIIGLLIVGAGQWLMGGHYALSPITWCFIGVVAAIAHRLKHAQPRTVPA